jgi:hypothetical protein
LKKIVFVRKNRFEIRLDKARQWSAARHPAIGITPEWTTLLMTPELSISLTEHLLSLLLPLSPHLPSDLYTKLAPYLEDTKVEACADVSTVPTIPYTLLLDLSRWVRTANVAEIDSRRYTMLNLLAGSTTSPNAHFTPYEPATAEDEGRRAKEERRAITALLNGLFSVVGSGAAVWMVTENRGWSVERVSTPFQSLFSSPRPIK